MFVNQLFEGPNANQGESTYYQLLTAFKEGRGTYIDGMPVGHDQIKHLLGKFKHIQKKKGDMEALNFLGDYGQIGATLDQLAEWANSPVEKDGGATLEPVLKESCSEVGARVIVYAPNIVEGKKGYIVEFNPKGTFIKVDLGADGIHTMHPTDVKRIADINEGAIDDLEQHRIDILNDRMDDLFARAGKLARTNLSLIHI